MLQFDGSVQGDQILCWKSNALFGDEIDVSHSLNSNISVWEFSKDRVCGILCVSSCQGCVHTFCMYSLLITIHSEGPTATPSYPHVLFQGFNSLLHCSDVYKSWICLESFLPYISLRNYFSGCLVVFKRLEANARKEKHQPNIVISVTKVSGLN